MARGVPIITGLVTENDALRAQLSVFLSENRYVVVPIAPSSLELLFEYPWDLLLIDGDTVDLSVIETLREDPHLRERFVLVATEDVSVGIESLNLGGDEYLSKPLDHGELLARLRAGQRILDLKKRLILINQRLELLSITDGLTGLYNHSHFQSQLAEWCSEARLKELPLSLLVIDLDRFKRINDRYGHAQGDYVLTELSNTLVGTIRSQDLLARYGGEEFALLLRNTGEQQARYIAERLRRTVSSMDLEQLPPRVKVTVSIGVASIPSDTIRSAAELFGAADEALYRAKTSGRDRVVVFSDPCELPPRKTRRSARVTVAV